MPAVGLWSREKRGASERVRGEENMAKTIQDSETALKASGEN